MKLIFSKNENESLEVELAKGTVTEEFSYVKLIKGLLENDKLDDTQFDESITDEEIEVIEKMVSRINDKVETESGN